MIPSVNYASLQQMLEEIRTHPAVKASDELQAKVDALRAYYSHIEDDLASLIQERKSLAQEISTLRGEDELLHGPAFEDTLNRFSTLVDAGASAEVIATLGQLDHLEETQLLKLLRTLFAYSLEDARQLVNKVQS